MHQRYLQRLLAGLASLCLLASCGGGDGGGDAGGGNAITVNNPMPLAQGDRWLYRSSDGSYEQVAVESFRAVGVLQAAVLATTQLDPQNASRDETLVARTVDGLLVLPDSSDPVSVAIGNMLVLPLPLQVRSSTVVLDRTISNGYDFDEDGRPDVMVLHVDQEVLAIESVTFAAGTFAGAAKVRTIFQLAVTLSGNGARVSTTATTDEWYAPDVGLVRETEVTVTGSTRTTRDRELLAYSVGGRRSDNQGPTVTAMTPAEGSISGFVNQVVIDFDEPVDASSARAGITVRSAAGTVLPATLTQVTATRFNLAFEQIPATGSYSLNVTATVADLWGNTRPARQLAWTVDRTGPAVVRSIPAAGAVDVALNSTFELEFNEDLSPSSVNSGTVQLRDRSRATVPTTVTLVNPRTVRLSSSQPLEPGATYVLWVGLAVRDVHGVGNDNSVEVFFNTVQGQFAFPTALANGLGRHLAVGDFTGDGLADLLDVPDSSSAALRLHTRRAGGGYEAPRLLLLPDDARCGAVGGLRVADLNGDGRPDVLLTRAAIGCGIQVWRQAPDGSLAIMAELPSSDVGSVVLADVNADGRIDIVAAAALEARVSVWLQTAPGVFGSEATYAAVDNARGGLAVGDVNGDGRADIVVTSGQFDTARALTILPQQADGSFGPAQSRPLAGGSGETPVTLADVNGDGRTDIVVQAPGSGGLWVLRQLPDGSLAVPLSLLSFDAAASIVVADFNGDGRADIATTSSRGGGPHVFTQAANGSFDQGRAYAGSPTSDGAQMAVIDVNTDGRPDIVLSGPYVLINLGGVVVTSIQATPAQGRSLRLEQTARAKLTRSWSR